MRTNLLLAAITVVLSPPAIAQVAAAGPAAPISTTPAMSVAAPAVLRAGTGLQLRMAEPLTTKGKKLRVGQRFQLEVAEALAIDGQVVIPAGSPATGEITEVRNKGMWGKSGRINARVLYVRANGRQIRLTGALDDKGTTGTASVVGAAVLLPIAGFFMTGTSAEIPLGAPVRAFIDEDVTLAFTASDAAPMVVPATTPQ